MEKCVHGNILTERNHTQIIFQSIHQISLKSCAFNYNLVPIYQVSMVLIKFLLGQKDAVVLEREFLGQGYNCIIYWSIL